MIIAAIAGANDCMVVTDNEKDFAGMEFLNPMRGRTDMGINAVLPLHQSATPQMWPMILVACVI